MIRYYKGRMAGDYHIKSNIPCQDSLCVARREDGVVFAAVADGLGSLKLSDIGSRIAASTAVEYCKENIKSMADDERAMKILNNAFVHAYKAILEDAEKSGNDAFEYDTTLCLAVFDGEKLFYGQAGDSGMIALLSNGEYVQITSQQRDSDGYVFPLSFGPDYWVFGKADKPVSAVMLMTDGIWDQLCPKILDKADVKIYRALARSFMDRGEDNDCEVLRLEKKAREYWDSYPVDMLDDDKTFVVIYNPEKRARLLDATYYAIPDWDALNRQAREKLYTKEVTEEDAGQLSVQEESTVDEDTIVTGHKEKSFIMKLFATGYHMLILLLLIGVSIIAAMCSGVVKEHYQVSYGAIFVICLLANSSVFFPAPSLVVVFQYSLILNPVAVAFLGALGASIGEMVGYMTGYHSGYVIGGKWPDAIKAKFMKNPYLIVFAASVVPLPVFDVVGVLAGAAKLGKRKFYSACFAGKLIKMLTIALMAEKLIDIIV